MLSVHPRLRGELDNNRCPTHRESGSSPLARGTRPRHVVRFGSGRFIPACAGNSSGRRMACESIAVHPRLRGELSIQHISTPSIDGSSPLARGTPKTTELQRTTFRFIPACAGNSLSLRSTACSLSGSSPLARGTRSNRSCRLPPMPVHPRLRGEL